MAIPQFPRPLKTPRNHPLTESLHARGVTHQHLADAAGTSRAQVTLTLQNLPGRGAETRPKLIPFLTARELVLLRWAPDEKTAAELKTRLARKNAPPKVFPVECSTATTEP